MRHRGSLYILGLTGSIGAGKSETARLFQRLGYRVSEADEIVKELYETSALLQEKLSTLFPQEQRPLSRSRVGDLIVKNPFFLKEVEQIIHPLVRERHNRHIQEARAHGDSLIVLDIPLLFETGWEKECDGILVVTCQPAVQKQRVLARQGMTEEKFTLLQQRQWSAEKKCARADFVLDTTQGRLSAFIQLRHFLESHCMKEN